MLVALVVLVDILFYKFKLQTFPVSLAEKYQKKCSSFN